tara:strand:- start:2491 stop:3300 length:810 start_codon:yes stop_codon:yes gene_type:complete
MGSSDAYISFNACSQYKQKNDIDVYKLPERIQYVNNPNSNDTLCISEIERAKEDIDNGKIVFTQSAGFLFGDIRYETELRELCKENGLVFEFDLIGCVVFEHQTQGCYGDYMDKVIIDKYGIDFKENLHKEADSLFLSRTQSENKIVEYWDCDERPRLPNENKRTSDYIPSITVDSLDIKEKKGNYGGWPFFDLGFTVEKDSTISGFYSRNFVAQLEENEEYKNELFEIAVTHIKTKYSTWVPGKVNGVPVRAKNNVRIFIKKRIKNAT